MQQTTYKLVTKGKIYFSFIPVEDIHIFFYTYYQFRKFFSLANIYCHNSIFSKILSIQSILCPLSNFVL